MVLCRKHQLNKFTTEFKIIWKLLPSNENLWVAELIKWFQRRNYGLKGTAVLLWLPDGCAWAAFVPGCCPEAEGARRACGCVGARGPSVCGWVVSSGRGRGPGAAGRGLLSFAASPCRCWGPGVTTLQADRNGKVEAVFVSARGKSGQQKKNKNPFVTSAHHLCTKVNVFLPQSCVSALLFSYTPHQGKHCSYTVSLSAITS